MTVKNSKAANLDRASASPSSPPPDREQILEALARLRRLSERLPQIDAAAVIREIRDANIKENR